MKSLIIALLVLSSTAAFAAPTNYLKITAYENLASKNCESLDSPKEFIVDAAFVKKNYCLEFYAFLDRDVIESMCFVGKPATALEIIDEILAVSTGDAYVYPADKATVTKNKVTRDFNYEDEGGEHSESASVGVCK